MTLQHFYDYIVESPAEAQRVEQLENGKALVPAGDENDCAGRGFACVCRAWAIGWGISTGIAVMFWIFAARRLTVSKNAVADIDTSA